MIVVIFAFQCLQRYLKALFFAFYHRRAARKQYFRVLSSPRGAGTILLPFYRRRAARKQYFCHFIVAVQRGNNIYAVLSSPCSAGTIFMPFYRRRAAREQYFRVSVLAASLRALKFLFSSLQNGGTCWNGRGGACVPARTSAQRRFHTKIYLRITHHARGFNDGCAPAGRLGRAHRHRPYPSPSYFSVQSAHNQRPHLPRSYKTIHHLEMNERQNITIHHCVPTNSRIKSVSTRNVNVGRFDTSTSPTYLRAADNELTRSIRLTSLCKRIPKLCFES